MPSHDDPSNGELMRIQLEQRTTFDTFRGEVRMALEGIAKDSRDALLKMTDYDSRLKALENDVNGERGLKVRTGDHDKLVARAQGAFWLFLLCAGFFGGASVLYLRSLIQQENADRDIKLDRLQDSSDENNRQIRSIKTTLEAHDITIID